MGTFLGHFVPGLALVILGLWHTINTIQSYYLKGSDKFMSRFWYPFNNSLLKLKELQLVLLLTFSLLALVLQVIDYPLSFNLVNFEHATMFLHLAIFSGFSLIAELTRLSDSVFPLIGIMASSVFSQELFLLRFHSTDHVGLEGQYHGLLQLIVLISLLASISTTVFPASFPAALVLPLSVLLQGCWFINMGFILWVPKFVPRGCFVQLDNASSGEMVHGGVPCASPEADFRARALANLQLSWILAGILMVNGGCCLIFARKGGPRLRAYEQLQSRIPDSSVVADCCLKRPLDL